MRPNTWLHRPSLRREDSPCQLGAVHTWGQNGLEIDGLIRSQMTRLGSRVCIAAAVNRRSKIARRMIELQRLNSIGVVRPHDLNTGAHHDLQVEQQTPIIDVPKIVFDPLMH